MTFLPLFRGLKSIIQIKRVRILGIIYDLSDTHIRLPLHDSDIVVDGAICFHSLSDAIFYYLCFDS